ncbi:MAG: radical SAM protein [Dehalococcoidia bacterium]|nr:radical SAM protein [Dehalococcoidia bacterium]
MAGVKEKALTKALRPLIPILFSERTFGTLLYRVARVAAPKEGKWVVENFARMWREETPEALLIKRIMRQTNRRCKTQFVANMIMRQFWLGAKRREEVLAQEGFKPSWVYLISPTMRCNLRCKGCYAASYNIKDDLELEVINRVLDEGKELGIYFVTILGGEPFIRKDMWEVYRRHDDVMFQVFTNGTLIDREAAHRLGRLGNVFPIFSIEGFEEETDARRGKGVFRRVMQGMDNLREAGVAFGFSSMVTCGNVETIISDEFNDMLIDKGCLLGWHFLYIPVGRNPDPSLMPTAEQRERMRLYGAARIRSQKPILICDFWNDAPLVGGCIAGGRYYFHINNHGDVEPCIFVHFAVDNVKNKSLRQIMQSPFFEGIRARQPYHENLLRPCMIIDHPTVLRDIYAECQPYPTHQGSESLITSLCGALDEYASAVAQVLDPAWQREFADRGFVPKVTV